MVSAATVAAPVALPVKKLDGSDVGSSASISLRVADEDTANGLVHRYLVMVRQNARQGNASTLTRSEVRGGGRKPYKQKGSGNARRGSRRSPLMPGGGISFGPKPRDWSISMNKKERKLACATALQSAAADMLVCDDFGALEAVSTKGLVASLAAMGVQEGEKVLLVVNEANEKLYLSGRNLPTLAINTANAVQVYDVLNADRIVVEQSALAYLNEWFGESQA
ncbi:hypothetical protein CHLNCDRAFT_49059 [Chlorella variabilis]|uniref:Large ribosomal subunit protein uL4c n=1 Tax=Chlorella variabilis TaxID=554065 RepID=E1ZMF4_CHLVA|nr:hypothetical protein CHLNCDRAFT_49059 [Chlorella variabilis]EFN52995.1 hypothetical protein CHLNCDRAFT_49059 [Chlorella variabilis]|eukprot:XP_005845097.1 hypothetical protein CHLNCDRAFT_49059 [Chlorella variabilis]